MSALNTLLDLGAGHDAEYGRGLSNHLPMALVALHRLGADDARLASYAGQYALRRKLRPAPPPMAWPAGDAWTSRLGQPRAWTAYRDLFTQWLSHEGAGGVLAQTLPALMPGVSAAAFHGLIRTAYGLQAGHAAEVADGLAYWACRHQSLGAIAPLAGTEPDPAALLRRLRAGNSRAALISERMAHASRAGTVNRVIAGLRIEADTPERLARAAAYAYAQTGNFTALHLVTATHAMRIVATLAEDADSAWRWFWQAYAHGVVAAALQPAALPPPTLEWPTIVGLARDASDEHVIKLVDSARDEAAFYGDEAGDWQRAAARAVGRLITV